MENKIVVVVPKCERIAELVAREGSEFAVAGEVDNVYALVSPTGYKVWVNIKEADFQFKDE